MASQTQAYRPSGGAEEEPNQEIYPTTQEGRESTTKRSTDDLLDEIDALLNGETGDVETPVDTTSLDVLDRIEDVIYVDPEEVLRTFIQQGGQ